MTTYNSQFGEDKWIDENITLPEYGFYLDIGAADPVRLSNTHFLHKNGWHGLCVDGDARQVNLLSQAGKTVLHAVVTQKPQELTFHEYEHADLSGVSQIAEEKKRVLVSARKVRTTPVYELKRLLFSVHINYCSLDVEGMELEVLTGMQECDMYPDVMIVEFDSMGRPDISAQILAKLKEMGYRLVHTTKANYIVVHQSFKGVKNE